jgi:hypothetical protein
MRCAACERLIDRFVRMDIVEPHSFSSLLNY